MSMTGASWRVGIRLGERSRFLVVTPQAGATCSRSRIEREARPRSLMVSWAAPSRRGRRTWGARKRTPRLAGLVVRSRRRGRLVWATLVAAGDASGGAPPGAPGDPAGSEHDDLPSLQ